MPPSVRLVGDPDLESSHETSSRRLAKISQKLHGIPCGKQRFQCHISFPSQICNRTILLCCKEPTDRTYFGNALSCSHTADQAQGEEFKIGLRRHSLSFRIRAATSTFPQISKSSSSQYCKMWHVLVEHNIFTEREIHIFRWKIIKAPWLCDILSQIREKNCQIAAALCSKLFTCCETCPSIGQGAQVSQRGLLFVSERVLLLPNEKTDRIPRACIAFEEFLHFVWISLLFYPFLYSPASLSILLSLWS